MLTNFVFPQPLYPEMRTRGTVVAFLALVASCRSSSSSLSSFVFVDDRCFISKAQSSLSKTDMVPGLQRVIGLQEASIEAHFFEKEKEWNRLKYIFGNFLQATCRVGKPVVLFLDDLQWVDTSTLDLVIDLVTNDSIEHLLFIGSYRSNEVGDDHPLKLALANISGSKRIETIQLEGLSRDATEEFIADTLRIEVAECSFLSKVVHNKTKGNIFFVKQALEKLLREKAVYKSMTTLKWTWDEGKVMDLTKVSDNVLDLVMGKIATLPEKLQNILSIAAFLRSTFTFDVLIALLEYLKCSILSQELIAFLDTAVNEELLVEKGMLSTYKFAHDKIKQGFYSRIPTGDEKDAMKVRIASFLIDNASSTIGESWMLFVAADHLNSVDSHGVETLDLIRLNLDVGEKAVEVSAFVPALSYLRKAMECVASVEQPWELNYDLTIRLYRVTADVEFCLGNFERGKGCCDEIIAHANSLEEKLGVQLALGEALGKLVRHAEGMLLHISTLQSIHEFPAKFYRFHVIREFRKVKAYFRSHSDYDILLLPPMTDKVKEAAMEHLSELRARAYSCSYLDVIILSILRSLRLTFKYGVCATSAKAFSSYGHILCGNLGDQEGGLRIARLAEKILEKVSGFDRVKAKYRECSVLCNNAVFM